MACTKIAAENQTQAQFSIKKTSMQLPEYTSLEQLFDQVSCPAVRRLPLTQATAS